jgi:hypothetical protein
MTNSADEAAFENGVKTNNTDEMSNAIADDRKTNPGDSSALNADQSKADEMRMKNDTESAGKQPSKDQLKTIKNDESDLKRDGITPDQYEQSADPNTAGKISSTTSTTT